MPESARILGKSAEFRGSRPPKIGPILGFAKIGLLLILSATVPIGKSADFQKKSSNGKMSGQKTLFRGASYTRNPKSVLCLAGHLKSGSTYKAVYNIRS